VTEESAGWMTLAFAAIAVIIRGDQEKWFRMGDLTSEGHVLRSLDESSNNQKKIWLVYSFTSMHRSFVVRESRAMRGGLSQQVRQIMGH